MKRPERDGFDPYGVLDCPRDADPATIKRAFRSKAKQAHPDAGGDAETFAKVTRANLILSDPERRARYDETGQADDLAPDVIDQAAWNLIGSLVDQIMAKEKTPTRIDFIGAMRSTFKREIDTGRAKIMEQRAAVERVETLRGRFTRRTDGGENVIERMVEWKIAEMRKPIAGIEDGIRVRERALALLADYEYRRDPDAVQIVMFGGNTVSSSSTATG